MRILDKQPVASKSINKVYATFDSDENMAEFLKTVKKFYFLKFKKKDVEITDSSKVYNENRDIYIFNPYKIYLIGPRYYYPCYDKNENKYKLKAGAGEGTDKEKELYSITLKPIFEKEQTFSIFEKEEINIEEPPCLYTNITFGKGTYLECAYEEK